MKKRNKNNKTIFPSSLFYSLFLPFSFVYFLYTPYLMAKGISCTETLQSTDLVSSQQTQEEKIKRAVKQRIEKTWDKKSLLKYESVKGLLRFSYEISD